MKKMFQSFYAQKSFKVKFSPMSVVMFNFPTK